MDAFEQLVSEILWMSGFWVRTSVRVELTKEEKRLIGRHSAPRWELDIVGCSARENLLRVVECKSYIDSTGVRASAFDGSNPDHATRYKLFNEPELRRIVFNRLCLQFTEAGACREGAQVRFWRLPAERSGTNQTARRSVLTSRRRAGICGMSLGCANTCSTWRIRATKIRFPPSSRSCY